MLTGLALQVLIFLPQTYAQHPTNQFMLGAMDNTFANHSGSYADLLQLKFNYWHDYTAPRSSPTDRGSGWNFIPSEDFYDTPLNIYRQSIINKVNANTSNNFYTLFDRAKIQYLCFGQSSEYQCERVEWGADYDFYSYNNSKLQAPNFTDIFDGNIKVKQCLSAGIPSNYEEVIISGLRGNREQASTYWPYGYIGDQYYHWYIMPKIRIDQNFANNNANWNVPVCKIRIINALGDVKEQILYVKNFRADEQTFYNGNYIEEYFPQENAPLTNFRIDGPSMWFNITKKWVVNCQVDFQVVYFGKCDMWIDYVKVQNEPAYRMLTHYDDQFIHGNISNPVKSWLEGECELARDILNDGGKIASFYAEEFEFNHMPTMKFVNDKIKEITNNRLSLMPNYNYDMFKGTINLYRPNNNNQFTAEEIKKYLVDYMGIREIFSVCYGLEGWSERDFEVGTVPEIRVSKSPNTLPIGSQDYDKNLLHLTYSSNPNIYDEWLQENLDNINAGSGQFKYAQTITYILKHTQEISKICNIPFYYLPQAHVWWHNGHKLKEPNNAEAELMNNLAIGYGAKGIIYFWYGGFNSDIGGPEETLARGLLDIGLARREYNVYGERKWDKYKEMSEKIKSWEKQLMKFNTADISSFKYQKECEVYQGEGRIRYINDLKTYKPILPHSENLIAENTPEVLNKRFIQLSFFNKVDDFESHKYFMITNKRCSPFRADLSDPGGLRKVVIKLHIAQYSSFGLNKYNNFNIIDISNNNVVATFHRDNQNPNLNIDLGWFQPGEGKIFKIAPMLHTGGEFIVDENLYENPVNFECTGIVNTNGKNLWITSTPSSISFAQNSGIIVNGGTLMLGSPGVERFRLKSIEINKPWNGIKIENEGDGAFFNVNFENVKNDNYMINSIDGRQILAQNCEFISPINTNVGGISSIRNYSIKNMSDYFDNNRFLMGTSNKSAINLFNAGGVTTSPYLKYNQFTATNASFGIILNGASTTISNNSFYNFRNSIILMNSSADIKSNLISSNSTYSTGVHLMNSNGNFGISENLYLGGFNNFNNLGDQSRNIRVNNSTFNILNGYNQFNILNSENGNNFHLYGFFPNELIYDETIPAYNNCYKRNHTVGQEIEYITLGENGAQLSFNYSPYSCSPSEPDGIITVSLGNGYEDTIQIENSTSGIYDNSIAMSKYILMCNYYRLRNFDSTIILTNYLLNNYADSIPIFDVVFKSFHSNLITDSLNTKINNLKNYFEQLIINNPNNIELIQIVNYYTQKCRVVIRDYEGALEGFLNIILNNPDNFIGLLATWDYSATYLLQQQGGISGGDNSSKSESGILNDSLRLNGKIESGDKKNKSLNHTIENADRRVKENNDKLYKELKRKVNSGDKNSLLMLESKKTFNELVKIRKPENIDEHLSRIENDLKKIHSQSSLTDNVTEEIVLKDYTLEQNYPNPFNPNTRIGFNIPKESKVTLVIYDILGRMVVKLLDNDLRTIGRHEVQFNGDNLASGIYFYKLVTNDFVATKKMILMK